MNFYRTACIVLILTGLIKLSGQFLEPAPKNETERQLLELMSTYQMDVGNGATVTMYGTQMGFGLWFSLSLIWAGVMSLFLVKHLKHNRPVLRNVAIMNSGFLLLGVGISLVYFFFIPTTCLALSLIFFVLASIRIK